MIARLRPLPLRLGWRPTIGMAGLAVLTIGGGWWRATSIVNRLLRNWAVGVVAQQSAGVYQLDPIGVHVNWFLRRVVVDSFRLTTDHGANARHRQPLADVRIGLSRCTISGVHVLTLVRGAGLIAASLGCAVGNVAVVVPRGASDSRPVPAPPPSKSGERPGFLVLQQGLRLPSCARRVQITQVTFLALAFDFHLPFRRGGDDAARARTAPVAHGGSRDRSSDTSAASRPLFSREIELVANNFVAHPARTTAVRVGMPRASLTDSTLETDIQATAVNVIHRIDRGRGSETMSPAATARLQKAAPLDLFAIPLDAAVRYDLPRDPRRDAGLAQRQHPPHLPVGPDAAGVSVGWCSRRVAAGREAVGRTT